MSKHWTIYENGNKGICVTGTAERAFKWAQSSSADLLKQFDLQELHVKGKDATIHTAL